MLQSVAIPTSLNYDDFESVGLSFSHRIDILSNRSEQVSQPNQLLGLVQFDVTVIERVK